MDVGGEMRADQMKPLVSDLDYYAEAYRAYAGFSGHKLKLYQKWADDIFVPQAVDKLQRSFEGIKEFRVLGIGSGGGEMDVCLLERLSSRFPSISNTVIEPSSDAIAKYTALLKEKEASLQGVKTDFKQTTIQEFCRETKKTPPDDSRPKFHFIHAIQSLYYTSDLKGTIEDMYDMLEIGGAMLILMMTDEHVLYRMWDRFPFLMKQQTISTMNLSSKDIMKVLQELGLGYTLYTVNCWTEGSSCFDPESDKGNKVLDFLTNTVRFRATASTELCDKVLSFLSSICPSSSSSSSSSPSSSSSSSSSLPVSGDETSEGVLGEEKKKAEEKLFFIRDAQSIIVFCQDTV